jgi:hypothetical protein
MRQFLYNTVEESDIVQSFFQGVSAAVLGIPAVMNALGNHQDKIQIGRHGLPMNHLVVVASKAVNRKHKGQDIFFSSALRWGNEEIVGTVAIVRVLTFRHF